MIKENKKYLNELSLSLDEKISYRIKLKKLFLKLFLYFFISSLLFWNNFFINEEIVLLNNIVNLNHFITFILGLISFICISIFAFFKVKNKNILGIEKILSNTKK